MAQENAKSTPSSKKGPLAHGVGRRKSSVARVWFHRGSGKISVAKQDIKDYFDTKLDYLRAITPVKLVPTTNYDISVNVRGGGKVSQADAIKLAIARCILSLDESTRSLLRSQDLWTVDSRVKERKKPGQKAARRKFQFVKR